MPVQAREHRRKRRARTRHVAWIKTGADAKPIQCVLWDRSDAGARVAAPHANKLPQVFMLCCDKGPNRLSRVVWRKGPLMGVQFIEGSEVDLDDDLAAARKAPPSPTARPLPETVAL